MTRHILRLALILAPGAAFAHAGAHLHPHGAGSALIAMGVAALDAAGAWLILRDR